MNYNEFLNYLGKFIAQEWMDCVLKLADHFGLDVPETIDDEMVGEMVENLCGIYSNLCCLVMNLSYIFSSYDKAVVLLQRQNTEVIAVWLGYSLEKLQAEKEVQNNQ